MFGFAKNKQHERFYLLPGMGGRALRRKRRMFFWWSIAAGVVASAALAAALYWIAR
ncbi:MAG TPA: hypothetical protein VMU04_19555 [Candidatus Acidoferrum sp.]|nr:hypothetical protein [Candidatus Acidoferrum sp.]